MVCAEDCVDEQTGTRTSFIARLEEGDTQSPFDGVEGGGAAQNAEAL